MELELRHLRVVCAIAETGSLTKAASALGVPQPALTTQLQRIERVFGGPLFERDQRGAHPTALGELVFSRARVLLPAVRGLQNEARLAAAEGIRRHRIGAVNGPILAGLLHRLGSQHPQVRITTHSSSSASELADMLTSCRLDFALVGLCGNERPVAEDALIWREVAVDPVFVLLSEEHPLATAPEVKLSDFADQAWVAGAGDGCFGDCFIAACADAGFTPRKLYEADVLTCFELVSSGDAVGLCQGGFRRAEGVVAVPLAESPLKWRQALGWHPEAPAAEFAEYLVRYASESYAAAVRRSPRYAGWLDEHPQFGLPALLA